MIGATRPSESLRDFVLAFLALGLWERRNRWKELLRGERWHTRSHGISPLGFLPLRSDPVYRLVDPAVAFLAGLCLEKLGFTGLGLWICFSAVCLCLVENYVHEKQLEMDLDTLDSLLERLWSGGARAKGRREEDRQPAPSPANEKEMPLFGHDRAYVAFELRENASRLHIQSATQPSRFPAYNYLLDTIYDHDFASVFTLIYSFMVVEVTGRNLNPIVHALNFGNCERIREFHKKLHDAPAKNHEPLIESITITAATLPSPPKSERA